MKIFDIPPSTFNVQKNEKDTNSIISFPWELSQKINDMPENNYPKIHNATWPGIVGKGAGSEPPISFDDMLAMTAAAEVDGIKFDGVDLGLLDPHINIDSTDDQIKKLVEKVESHHLKIG